MARINRIPITPCASLFTTLPFTPMTHASKQARMTPTSIRLLKTVDKKKSATTSQKATKASKKTATKTTGETSTKTASSSKKRTATSTESTKTTDRRGKTAAIQTAAVTWTEKCTPRKGHKPRCMKVKTTVPATLVDAHKVKVQEATKTAMSTLMNQIGKSYRWGGSPSRTRFDCSGLVYYAHKDLVKFRIPRTANKMYHLRGAASIERGELKNGDLVFLRTQGHGTADHVGVYADNGRFIRSPRSGQEIQITSLSEDYWQHRYVGTCRVITPKTIR